MADRACMMIIKNGRVLMVYQTYRGETFWTFPGGSIEPGETPEAAAVREVKEEVHLDVVAVRLLHCRPRKGAEGMYYCYLGKIVAGEMSLGSDPELKGQAQELHQASWLPLKDIASHPEVAESLAWMPAPFIEGR